MKKIVFKYIALFMALVVLAGCEKTPIQKANDAYDFSKIVPVVQGISGPSNGVQTFTGTYSPNYFRGGSTWNWSAVNASIASVSTDTRECVLQFDNNGEVILIVTETTMGGLTSQPDSLTISVAAFCPLVDLNDLAGTWTGTDSEGFDTQVVTTVVDGEFLIDGLNKGWMVEYWGETIEEYIPLVVTMNGDGTLEIARQYVMTTLWNGEPYRYEISATGRWDNCLKTLYIEYSLFYEGDAESTADITEDITLVTP